MNKYAFDPSKYMNKKTTIEELPQNKEKIDIIPSMLQEVPKKEVVKNKYVLERRNLQPQKVKINKKQVLRKIKVGTVGVVAVFAMVFALNKPSAKTSDANTQPVEVVQEINTQEQSTYNINYEQLVKIAQEDVNNQPQIEVEEKEEPVVEIIEEETPVFNFEDRLVESSGIVGSNSDMYESRLTDEMENAYNNASKKWGVDSNILIAMGKQETNLTNASSKYAKGIMQIENVNRDGVFKAYNFEKNEYETVRFANLDLENINDNIEAAAVIFQDRMEAFDYNILFVIQSYNYGRNGMIKAIEMAKADLGKEKEELTLDEVTPYLEYIHSHPKEVFKNWEYDRYGDPYYANRIRMFSSERMIYVETPNAVYFYDLETGRRIAKCDKNENGNYVEEDTKFEASLDDYISLASSTQEKETKTY